MRRGGRSGEAARFLVPLALGLVILLSGGPAPLGTAAGARTAVAASTVTIGPLRGVVDSATFWGISAHMNPTNVDGALANLVNATPFTYFRFGGGDEQTNQSANVTYTNGGKPTKLSFNATGAVTWCRWVRCHSIWPLPAEINSTAIAAWTVRFIEQNLSFHPDYWSLGNEPTGWRHYNIPWTRWKTRDDSKCSALCYAQLVHRMLPALRAVDPNLKLIGIQQAGCGSSSYLYDVVKLNGPNLSAVACHIYPASGINDPTLSQFFGALQGSNSLPVKIPKARSSIASACKSCNLPLWVDEYNAAGGSTNCPPMSGYPDVPFIAASAIQALELNLSQFTFFTLSDYSSIYRYDLIAPGDTPNPTYWLYADFLDEFPLGSVYPVSLNANVSGGFAVMGENSTARSLLVVNTDVSGPLTLNLSGSGFFAGLPGRAESWSTNSSAPSGTEYGALPSTWTVPPEGLLELSTGA
jgi:hypothetical protein